MACGTVSTNVLDDVKRAFPQIPFFGVLDAACETAARLGARRVAVAATEATIRSGAYERRLKAIDPGLEVCSKACQSLVLTVERGHFCPGDPFAEAAVEKELSAVRAWKPDTLILACTHFPLLSDIIADYLGPDVRLLSVGAETARALKTYLQETGKRSGMETGERRWFTSGGLAEFSEYAEIFLGHKVRPERHLNTIL